MVREVTQYLLLAQHLFINASLQHVDHTANNMGNPSLLYNPHSVATRTVFSP